MARVEDEPLEGVLDVALEEAEDGDISIADFLEAFGDRGFGPVLTLLGLLAVSPVAAVPGVAPLIGLIVILIAGQLLIGKSFPWLPGRLRRLGFSRDKVAAFRDRARGWLERLDRLTGRRLTWAAGPIARRVAAGVAVCLGALMAPLEFIPFAVALPGAALALFGLALTARDGVMMLAGFALTGVTAWFAIGWLG